MKDYSKILIETIGDEIKVEFHGEPIDVVSSLSCVINEDQHIRKAVLVAVVVYLSEIGEDDLSNKIKELS